MRGGSPRRVEEMRAPPVREDTGGMSFWRLDKGGGRRAGNRFSSVTGGVGEDSMTISPDFESSIRIRKGVVVVVSIAEDSFLRRVVSPSGPEIAEIARDHLN